MKKKIFSVSPSDVVKRLRAERNLSQLELSRRVGMSAAQLCKIERGNSELTASTMRRISDALGVPVSVLLGEAAPELAVSPIMNEPRAESIASGAEDYVPVLSPSAVEKEALGEIVKVERILSAEEARLGIEGQAALQLVYSYGSDERSAELLARDVRVSLGIGNQPRGDLAVVLENVGVHVITVRRPGNFQSAAFYNRRRRTLSIALNSKNTAERNMYRLAYELGGTVRFASSGYCTVVDEGAEHRFLRAFTAAFLMPEESVRGAVARLGIGPRQWTIETLVFAKERFGVSAEAFALRLESLGLIVPALRQDLRDGLRARYAAHPRSMEPHPPKGQTLVDILKRIK